MKEFYRRYRKMIDKLLFLLVFVALVYVFVKYLFALLAPFIIGYILSWLLEPMAVFFTKRLRLPRALSTVLCLLALVLFIGSVGAAIVTQILSECRSLAVNLPKYTVNVMNAIDYVTVSVNTMINFIPEGFRAAAVQTAGKATSTLSSALGSLVRQNGGRIVVFVPSMLFNLILCLISTFFFIKDKALIAKTLSLCVPETVKQNITVIKGGLKNALGGYIKAQCIMMCIVGTISIVGLSILRYPYALLIGLVIAVVDALPVFGSGTVLWPLAAFAAITHQYPTAVGLLVVYGIIFVTRQITEPRVLGGQIGVHPLLTLMSIYIGLQIFGVLGVFIGPVIVVTAKAIMDAEYID